MKLSDAIMLNGTTKPQGRGVGSMGSVDAPCAMGGALQSIGKQTVGIGANNYRAFLKEWPWARLEMECPACGKVTEVTRILWRLNDTHLWTRQQIAEWVARIEPQEPQQTGLVEIPEPCEVADELP